jgi:hypothetical protein
MPAASKTKVGVMANTVVSLIRFRIRNVQNRLPVADEFPIFPST